LRFVLLVLTAYQLLGSDSGPAPVTKLELVSGLATFQYQLDLVRRVRERGVDFAPGADFVDTLNRAGASKELVSAVRSARSQDHGDEAVIENQVISYVSTCAELEHRGQTGGVAENCEPALKLLPNNVFALAAISYALAHDFHSKDALPHIQQAVRLAPQSSEVHRVYAYVLMQEDAKEMEEADRNEEQNEQREQKYQERFDGAVSEYLEAIRLDPDNTMAHYELAQTYNSDEPERALEQFREVARLDPASAYALYEVGVSLAAQSRLDDALVELAKAEKADPSFARAYQMRASIFSENKQFNEAVREASKAVELEPRYTPYRLTLSGVFLEKGDFEQAIKVLREAASSDPENPVPSLYIAGIFHDRGDLARAISALREGIRLSPHWSYLHRELGGLLEETGDFSGAFFEYKEVMKLSGESEELQAAISRVRARLPSTTP